MKMAMMSKFAEMTSMSSFFHVAFSPLSGLVTGPGLMSILLKLKQYLFQELTRNLEIGNTPI